MSIISIGMPVYNGDKTLANAIGSILSQTFTDFELIISDNCSSDQTENICRQFALTDNRIKYIRQTSNIGAAANFKFVFDQASCEYFLWAACDDVRSNDFLAVNHKFLSENPGYVASTSPIRFEGRDEIVNFKLDGNAYERFITFFEYCWISNGIFYSLIKTEVLRKCEMLGQSFIAADWAIDLCLALNGKINCTAEGLTVLGANGVSNSAHPFRAFRNNKLEYLLPFYQVSKYAMKLARKFTFQEKFQITLILIKINITADFYQVRAKLYPIYCKYIRHRIRQ